jgi:hypothetical protein
MLLPLPGCQELRRVGHTIILRRAPNPSGGRSARCALSRSWTRWHSSQRWCPPRTVDRCHRVRTAAAARPDARFTQSSRQSSRKEWTKAPRPLALRRCTWGVIASPPAMVPCIKVIERRATQGGNQSRPPRRWDTMERCGGGWGAFRPELRDRDSRKHREVVEHT